MHSRIPFHGVTLIAFGTLLGVSSGEALLRLYSAFGTGQLAADLGQWDPYAVRIEPHGQVGYRQRPWTVFSYGGGITATSNAMGYRGPAVSAHKPPATFRLILLGGSATHGWGVRDSETIDAHMRSLLTERYPDSAFEVVNLAFDGYDSYQLFERLQSDGMRLDPGLIIVNSGINDVRNARFADLTDRDPRTMLWVSALQRLREERRCGGPSFWTRLKHHMYLARLPGLTRQYAVERRDHQGADPLEPNFAAADYFERNLHRIAELAQSRHIPVIFSTPPSALRTNFRPSDTSTRSYWVRDAITTQLVRDSLAVRMQMVVARLRQQGEAAAYVTHVLTPAMFLDDAHLTSAGNRRVAEGLVSAMAEFTTLDGNSVHGKPRATEAQQR